MADLRLDRADKPLGASVAKGQNLFHFRNVAFAKFNDFIFRKRLLQSSWRFRKKVLVELKNFFSTGREFDTNCLDLDTANLKRDYILMFGSPQETLAQLEMEAKFLPTNQKPNYHDRYALITELAKIKNDGPSLDSTLEITPSDQVAVSLDTMYKFLNKNTIKADETWGRYRIQNGSSLGRNFAAANEANAEKFLSEVVSAREQEARGDEISPDFIGLRALGFLGMDPLLNDPKTIEKEEELLTFIFGIIGDKHGFLPVPDTQLDTPKLKDILIESMNPLLSD